MFKKDHSELLFYVLRQLAQDQLTFLRGTNLSEALTIEIDEKDFSDKVQYTTARVLHVLTCLSLGEAAGYLRLEAILPELNI